MILDDDLIPMTGPPPRKISDEHQKWLDEERAHRDLDDRVPPDVNVVTGESDNDADGDARVERES